MDKRVIDIESFTDGDISNAEVITRVDGSKFIALSLSHRANGLEIFLEPQDLKVLISSVEKTTK